MNLVARGSLARAFRGSTDAERFQAVLRQQAIERDRRERKEDIDRGDADLTDFAIWMVSVAEVANFRLDLDSYDAATVTALQENGLALERILARKDDMLGKAHVLDDGRRVFESEDGVRVFDEFGSEVGASEVDPDLIEDHRPKWETYKPVLTESNRLIEERRALIDYQGKLDDARERLDAGDISRDEFDAMRKDLTGAMPDAVRKHVPGMETKQEAAAGLDQPAPATDLDITADMLPDAPPTKAPSLG